MREEERTKTCSSFLSKEGNDPPGSGPARRGQGSRPLPSLSQNQLPGQDSQPPRGFVHCLPRAWNGCPCHTHLKGNRISPKSTASFGTEESERWRQEDLGGTWYLYFGACSAPPQPRSLLPPGPVAGDTGWEPRMLRSADPENRLAQHRQTPSALTEASLAPVSQKKCD